MLNPRPSKLLAPAVVLALFGALAVPPALAQLPVTVTLNLSSPGHAIPGDFIGVSYETLHVLPNSSGNHYFSASNASLIRTFQVLGIKSLRVGGNTVDTGPIPSKTDVDDLFAFARAAGVDVIYTLKLKNSGASANAPIADYILAQDGANLTCFSVGNEANRFVKNFTAYEGDVKSYMAAIAGGKYCGPDASSGTQSWATPFAEAFASSAKVALVTQHHYLGDGSTNAGAKGRDALLSASVHTGYTTLLNNTQPAASKAGLPFRLTETNSFYHGGAADASNTFASALWGLDYLHWWAAHGAEGLNFHTGDTVSATVGGPNKPALYAVFMTSSGGNNIHPLGYGVKAFDVGGHGQVIPVSVGNASGLNLTVYGVLRAKNDLYVTIINKEHGTGARTAIVSVAADSSYTSGHVMFLTAPKGDVSVTTGVTLGGAAIADDATWSGTFSPLAAPVSGLFLVDVPPATAAVVHLQ